MKKLFNLLKQEKMQEFIRFVIVGIFATVISYGVYYLLLIVNFDKNIAYTLGYIVSFCFNFIATNLFTFKTKTNVNNGIRFALAHLTSYLIQLLLLNLFVQMGIPEQYAPFPVYVLAVPINFFIVRFALTYKQSNQSTKGNH